jgi:DNA-binding NarL/FixJ family response regulator
MAGTRILLADDHEVVLEGLRRILDCPGFEIVAAVKDGRALVEAAQRLKPDVIVADVSMPLLSGVEAARQITKNDPKAKIIFLSMHPENVYAVEAMTAGGAGYVLKETAARNLINAIREVEQGRMFVSPPLQEAVRRGLAARKDSCAAAGQLTQRQREVLQLLAEGKTPKEISGLLNVSSRTVEFHKYRIMETLGVRTVAELAAYAVKNGIV